MRLPFAEFVATYRVTQAFRMPSHAGGLWHGVLGRAVRSIACEAAPACREECKAPAHCAYARMCRPLPRIPPPHPLLAREKTPPPPLFPVLSHVRSSTLSVGHPVSVRMRWLGTLRPLDETLLRSAMAALTTFPLGRDAGRIEQVGLRISRGEVATRSDPVSHDPATEPNQRIELQLCTPAQLLPFTHPGAAPQTFLRFEDLFSDIHRRLTLVCALYGDVSPTDDARFHTLRALASHIQIQRCQLTTCRWERHAQVRNQRHPLQGVVGKVTLMGPLQSFLPYLQMATVAHIGKGTSFGLGQMMIHMIESTINLSGNG